MNTNCFQLLFSRESNNLGKSINQLLVKKYLKYYMTIMLLMSGNNVKIWVEVPKVIENISQ